MRLMRVIIYVPESRGAARTRRAIERDVAARGHEVVGCTSVPAEAMAAWRSRVVDVIAGRPDHLVELAAQDWALPITSRSAGSGVCAADTDAGRQAPGYDRDRPVRTRRYRRHRSTSESLARSRATR